MEPDYVLLPAVSPPPTPSNPFDLHVDQFINIISRKPSANREQDDDDDDDDPNHPKLADGSKIRKKHRPRVVLSCTTCVRRKTKCDQRIPCSACVKRGDPKSCEVPAVTDPETIKQPFATSDDLTSLQNRVVSLENLIHTLLAHFPGEVPPLGSLPFPLTFDTGTSSTLQVGSSRNDNTEEESVAAVLQRLREGNDEAQVFEDGSMSHDSLVSETRTLLGLLPAKSVADVLVESFFTRVDWRIHVLHTPSFKEDLKLLWKVHLPTLTSSSPIRDKSQLSLSANWISSRLPTIFMVLALGQHFLPLASSPYSSSEGSIRVHKWVDGALKALHVADWTGRPQLRTIQCILLLVDYWHNTGAIDKLVIILGTGMRVAQSLGMHQSTTSAPTFPYDDLSELLGESKAFFCTEMGNRLWWYLLVFEWDVSYRCRATQVFRAQDYQVVSGTPLNLTDEDLLVGPTVTRDLSQPTTTTFQVSFSDIVSFQQQLAIPRGNSSLKPSLLTLETVMSLDRLMLEMENKFPDYFKLEKAGDKVTRQIDVSHPYVPLQRANLAREVHSRRVRLHRHTMFTDDTESRTAARKSASILLSVVADLRNRYDYATKLWWVNAYTILAGATLLILNIISKGASGAEEEMESSHRDVLAAINSLRSNGLLNPHTTQGIRVLEALVAEEASSTTPRGPLSKLDQQRYKNALDIIAKATMCIGSSETLELKKLADGLSPQFSSSTFPPIDPNLDISVPANLFGGAVSDIGGPSSQEYDDFFRTLGFLPSGGDWMAGGDQQNVIGAQFVGGRSW